MVRPLIPLLLATLVAVGPYVAADGVREPPRATRLAWIEASIYAVQENGVAHRTAQAHGIASADGTVALPIKHVVRCATATTCTRVGAWARSAGYRPSGLLTEYLHGGVAVYEVHLSRHVALLPRSIQADALRIHEALARHAGSRYETWMLDVDPVGPGDAR